MLRLPDPITLGQRLIAFRVATSGDDAFLYRVYASTRAEELAQTGWGDEQKKAFLQMQFTAQITHYRQHYTDVLYALILVDERSAGRLYLQRTAESIHLLDIALLPEYRGHGIGEAILRSLQNEAAEADCPLSIYVEKFNPALRLYSRLGFVSLRDEGVYQFMAWTPPSGGP